MSVPAEDESIQTVTRNKGTNLYPSNLINLHYTTFMLSMYYYPKMSMQLAHIYRNMYIYTFSSDTHSCYQISYVARSIIHEDGLREGGATVSSILHFTEAASATQTCTNRRKFVVSSETSGSSSQGAITIHSRYRISFGLFNCIATYVVQNCSSSLSIHYLHL